MEKFQDDEYELAEKLEKKFRNEYGDMTNEAIFYLWRIDEAFIPEVARNLILRYSISFNYMTDDRYKRIFILFLLKTKGWLKEVKK